MLSAIVLQMQGMGDFLGEMAHMMSQTRPARQESFEELQQLFVDMFQSDIVSCGARLTDVGRAARSSRRPHQARRRLDRSPDPGTLVPRLVYFV